MIAIQQFSETHRRVFTIALPMTAASLSVPLLGVVDTAILGHLEHLRFLAAVAAGSTVMTMVYWLFAFLRMGSTGLTAQAWGRRDWQQCREYLYQSLLLALLLGCGLVILQRPLLPMVVALIQPSSEASQLALEYCQIRIFSAPATLCTYALLGWLLGTQRARDVLLILFTVNLLNIALDFFFIMGLDLNSRGAAWASFSAEWIGLAVALALAQRQLQRLPGKLQRASLLVLERYRLLFTVNRHLFVRTAFLLFTMSFFTAQGARLGDDILAANAILLQLLLSVAFIQDGFAHAAETLAGQAIGAGNRREFYAICGLTTLWGVAISVLAAAIYWLWPTQIIGFFTDLAAVFSNARHYWSWLVVLPIAGVLCFMADGIFIGGNQTRAMQNIMVLATAMVFLPCWYLTRSWGNHGLWFAYFMFLTSRSLLMTTVFFSIERGDGWLSRQATNT